MSAGESRAESLLAQQNRLLRRLTKAVLTSGYYGIQFDRDHPTQVFSQKKGLSIPAGATLTPIDLKDVDIGFFAATSAFDSAKLRHRITSRTGRGGIFSFDSTQQELAAAGLSAPSNNFLWTPSGLAGLPAGTFTIMFAPAFPVPLHEFFKLELINEDTVTANSLGTLFVAWIEVPKADRAEFSDILMSEPPEEAGAG